MFANLSSVLGNLFFFWAASNIKSVGIGIIHLSLLEILCLKHQEWFNHSTTTVNLSDR